MNYLEFSKLRSQVDSLTARVDVLEKTLHDIATTIKCIDGERAQRTLDFEQNMLLLQSKITMQNDEYLKTLDAAMKANAVSLRAGCLAEVRASADAIKIEVRQYIKDQM